MNHLQQRAITRVFRLLQSDASHAPSQIQAAQSMQHEAVNCLSVFLSLCLFTSMLISG